MLYSPNIRLILLYAIRFKTRDWNPHLHLMVPLNLQETYVRFDLLLCLQHLCTLLTYLYK